MKEKVLIVVKSLLTGGAERQVVMDANNLIKEGYSVKLLYAVDGDMRLFLDEGIEKVLVSKNSVAAFLQILNHLRKNRYQVIFGHMYWSLRVAAIPGFITSNRFIFFEHGLGEWRKWYHKLIIRLNQRFTEKIVVVSSRKRERKIRVEKTNPNKLILIHNSFFKGESFKNKRFDYLNNTDFKIIYLGRFSIVKQLHFFVQIAEQLLLLTNETFKIVLVGTGENEQELKSLVERKNLCDYFYFTGYQSKPYNILRQGDIFVLPSKIEDCSVALLEAGYCGLPLLAFDVGGNSEIIIHGKNGFLIKPYDINDMTSKVLFFMNNEMEKKIMGERSRDYITRQYSSEMRISNLLALIEHKTN